MDAAVAARARAAGVSVEAGLGRLAGEEAGISVDERDARMTDPAIVAAFRRARGSTPSR